MNVLKICDYAHGGASIAAARTTNALKKAGVEVSVLTGRGGAGYPDWVDLSAWPKFLPDLISTTSSACRQSGSV